MNLGMHVESLRQQLTAVAEMGGTDAKLVVERLSTGLEAAARLVLLEAIAAAADEITAELAPGAVEVRLRGSNPEFVVSLPSDASHATPDGTNSPGAVSQDEEGGTSRLNLRLSETLKGRIEDAARREGLSLNSWLVRVAAAAVDADQGHLTRSMSGSQRYTGWVR